jgi:holin-like protein
MLKAISIVLALSVIGDTAVDALQIPVPGAAIGLLFLTCLFVWRGGPDAASARLFDTISPVFPMFFVPAAVGIVANTAILSEAWLYVAVAICLGTAATIIVTGLIAQALLDALGEAGRA